MKIDCVQYTYPETIILTNYQRKNILIHISKRKFLETYEINSFIKQQMKNHLYK